MVNGLAQPFMFAKVIRHLSMFTTMETMVSLFTGNDPISLSLSLSLCGMTETPFIFRVGSVGRIKVLFLFLLFKLKTLLL